jgi:hypothetical protein
MSCMLSALFNIFKKKSPQDRFRQELKGFKGNGYSAKSLKKSNFPAWAVKAAGYSLQEMKDAGYSARALKLAEFPPEKVDKLFKK